MSETEDTSKTTVVGSPASVALYISAIAEELGQLAKTHGLETLGYILDMARLEADELSKSTDTARWVVPRSRRSS